MKRREVLIGASAAAFALAAPASGQQTGGSPILAAARAAWRRATVIDGNLYPPIGSETFPQPAETLAQARASGVTAIKASIGGFDATFEYTVVEIAFLDQLIEAHPETYLRARTVDDIRQAKRQGKLGIIYSFESVAALEDKLDRIQTFRELGVRVMQLSYNTASPFGAGVMAPPEAGLTELGREAVARMNELGVALDLSHANEATTAEAMAASTKPVLITHAGCAAVHPHPRHKSDAQLRGLADKGGVVGIYNLFFLAPPPRQPDVQDFMAHVLHALNVCGEDHVGFGSDTVFGAYALSDADRAAWIAETQRRHATGVAAPEEDGRLPYTEGLNRADRSLVIADALMRRGYPARVVEKVLGGNFLRAFGEIW